MGAQEQIIFYDLHFFCRSFRFSNLSYDNLGVFASVTDYSSEWKYNWEGSYPANTAKLFACAILFTTADDEDDGSETLFPVLVKVLRPSLRAGTVNVVLAVADDNKSVLLVSTEFTLVTRSAPVFLESVDSVDGALDVDVVDDDDDDERDDSNDTLVAGLGLGMG